MPRKRVIKSPETTDATYATYAMDASSDIDAPPTIELSREEEVHFKATENVSHEDLLDSIFSGEELTPEEPTEVQTTTEIVPEVVPETNYEKFVRNIKKVTISKNKAYLHFGDRIVGVSTANGGTYPDLYDEYIGQYGYYQ